MNKLYSKIAVLSASLALAVGVGVAVGSKGAVKEAKAAKGDTVTDATLNLSAGEYVTVSDDLGGNAISWSMASGKITVRQMRGSTKSTNAFTIPNSSYINAPRVYRGNYLEFAGTDDFKITGIKLTYTGSYAGQGPIVGDAITTGHTDMDCGSSSKKADSGILVTSDTTNYTCSQNSSDKTYTVTVNKVGGTDVLYFQSYKDEYVNTQLRLTTIQISYIVGNEAKAADQVVVTGKASLTVGETSLYSAECRNSGSATDVDQTVEWSVSDESVLSINNGNVTALSNGTANVIATSTNSIVGQLSVTVTGATTDTAPKTLSPDSLGISGNSYASNDGFHNARGYVVETLNIAANGNDVKTEEVITAYTKGALMFKASAGVLKTRTKVGSSKISAVTIVACTEAEPDLTIVGGESAGADTQSVGAAEHEEGTRLYRYAFSTPVSYLTVSKTTAGAQSINALVLEFGGAETVDSLADYILGLMPDRADETNLCKGENGNYRLAKARYAAASETVRNNFQSSEDETVAKARARYLAWAAAYGDATPFEQTMDLSLITSFESAGNNTGMIIIIAASTASLIGFGLLLILKKRKAQK